jgi:hypothetical protein
MTYSQYICDIDILLHSLYKLLRINIILNNENNDIFVQLYS